MGRAEEVDEGSRAGWDEKNLGGFARGYIEENVDWQIGTAKPGGRVRVVKMSKM